MSVVGTLAFIFCQIINKSNKLLSNSVYGGARSSYKGKNWQLYCFDWVGYDFKEAHPK